MAQVKHKELAPQRQGQIIEVLRRENVVRVDELCETLGVSPATVRRDLEELEARGELKRVHGGAVPADKLLDELQFDEKTMEAEAEKLAIAQAAYELVGEGETIYLDGGSTLLALARLLKNREDITVVTNSLRAAMELSSGGPRLIVAGGELRRHSQTLIGSLSALVLSELHVDKAFMGTIGISAREGLTTTEPAEAFTKKVATRAAREVILLADSKKFGKVSFSSAGGIDTVQRIITDDGLSLKSAAEFEHEGIRVDRVAVG